MLNNTRDFNKFVDIVKGVPLSILWCQSIQKLWNYECRHIGFTVHFQGYYFWIILFQCCGLLVICSKLQQICNIIFQCMRWLRGLWNLWFFCNSFISMRDTYTNLVNVLTHFSFLNNVFRLSKRCISLHVTIKYQCLF